MKYIKTFENENSAIDELKIKNNILMILNTELYTEGSEHFISEDGKNSAVDRIISYFQKIGVDFELLSNSKKYNL
jgi:hypothetical protein